MKREQFQSMLEAQKGMWQNPELVRLYEAYSSFVDLYASRNQPHKNKKRFEKELNDSYQMLWDAFYKATAFFGLDGLEIQQYLADLDGLSPEARQGMEAFRRLVDGFEAPASKKTKKKDIRI